MNSENVSPKNINPGGLKCVFGDGTRSLQRRSVPAQVPALAFFSEINCGILNRLAEEKLLVRLSQALRVNGVQKRG